MRVAWRAHGRRVTSNCRTMGWPRTRRMHRAIMWGCSQGGSDLYPSSNATSLSGTHPYSYKGAPGIVTPRISPQIP